MYDHRAGQPKVGRNRPTNSRTIRTAYARRSVTKDRPTLVGCDVGLLGEIYGSTRATYLLLSARAVSVCDRHDAKQCQTDATSCHETENGSGRRRFGYICPGLKTTYMEVVIIEKKTFEALLAGVETLTGKVSALCSRCNDKQMQKWLDGEEVCRLLRISPRTLQSLRDNRVIGCTQINRKFYYKPEEIKRLMPIAGQFRDCPG